MNRRSLLLYAEASLIGALLLLGFSSAVRSVLAALFG